MSAASDSGLQLSDFLLISRDIDQLAERFNSQFLLAVGSRGGKASQNMTAADGLWRWSESPKCSIIYCIWFKKPVGSWMSTWIDG